MSWLDGIRIVAVTDRKLMGDFAAAIARVVREDVLVQIREKDLDGAELLARARIAIAAGARVAVNDRVDVAIAAGAHAVHLPERGLAIADARALLDPAMVVGISCHDLVGVRAAIAARADLVQLGPIWDTPGKGPAIGPEALAQAHAAIREARAATRLVAVGGIDSPERVDVAMRAGADAVAAIRAVWTGGALID